MAQRFSPTVMNLGFDDPFLQRNSFAKSSHLTYKNGTPILVDKQKTYDRAESARRAPPPPRPPVASSPPTLQQPATLSGSSIAGPIQAWAGEPMPQKAAPRPEVLPAWVALSQKVLRFSGYFEEGVPESPYEINRVRTVHIYYYLEDDSMQVSEPRVDNSGIQQGLIVKRHRIPHPNPYAPDRICHPTDPPDGSVLRLKRNSSALPVHWTYRDLNIGRTVEIYRRRYRLTDADPFTREFYAVTLGSPLERPITKVPPDSYQQHRSIHDRGIDAKPPNRQRDAFTKYMESKMGIHATRSGDDPKKISKYIQNAGRVLRFFGSWIDTALFGRRHDLVIHYYLCDDTVEVVEKFPANSGCDKQGSLLKRGKLPRDTAKVLNLPGGYAKKTESHKIAQREEALMLTEMSGEQLLKRLSEKLTQKYNNITPLFRKFDEDKNNVVSYPEFRHGLSMLGFEPTDEVFEALLRLVDADASGSIDYVEFAANLGLSEQTIEQKEEELKEQQDVQYVHWRDLRPGSTLDCFGKQITIHDADTFTKRFFLLNTNKALDPQPAPTEARPPTPTLVVPPHDQGGGQSGVCAVGEPEDSLMNCLHLVAKAPRGPRQNHSRFMQYEGDILRFEAVMVSSEPTDAQRKFIVSYYIRDFTLAIFEPPQRNSGIIGGKFLDRTRVPNPAAQPRAPTPQAWNGSYRITMETPQYYEPKDLYIGAVLTVHHQDFHLYKCDLFTLNYMEKNLTMFPSADASLALKTICAQMAEHGLDTDAIATAIGANASDGIGTMMDVVQLKSGLGALGLRVNDQQVVSLARKYDTTGIGSFEAAALLAGIEAQVFHPSARTAW